MSADGRGQVLLYPYYNAFRRCRQCRDAGVGCEQDLVGKCSGPTSNSRKARTVGKCFELNLFLSPFDVWTAAILPNPTTAGARIGTVDRSCGLPAFSASPTGSYYSFVNSAYAGQATTAQALGSIVQKEGHFEVIEMATYCVRLGHWQGDHPRQRRAALWRQSVRPASGHGCAAASGGLFRQRRSSTSIPEQTIRSSHRLANFFQVGSNYNAIGTSLPDLTQAAHCVSAIFAPGISLYESRWGSGTADAVSAVLMHDTLLNEYTLDSATKSGTDWS